MEIYQLRAFVAVARVGHVTRAAEQLHLTQSAVSKQLKALEEELGGPLFDRTTAGMTPSAIGRRLLPLAQRTLDAAGELAAAARQLQGQLTGTLRLGTIVDPTSIRLGELLAEMQHHCPQVDVRLEQGISGTVLQRLKARELDACFFLGDVDDAEVSTIVLAVESYAVVLPPAWAPRVMGQGWAALAALPWIGTAPGSSQTVIMERLLRQQGLSRQTVAEVDQESTLLDLVQAGVGVCLARERRAQELLATGRIVAWDGERIACPLSLLMRTEDAARPLQAALRERIFSVWPTAVQA
nr:LysR family transcriptional regulator [Variovorax boronicumulans]